MDETINIVIGYDEREAIVFHTCVQSIITNTSCHVNILPICLKNFAKYRGAKPCIKRYLGRHIDSQIVEIPANEWEIATALPLARFKKARESRVHRESKEDA